MAKKKTKTVWCGGRKGIVIGPAPSDPDNLTIVEYAGGDVHLERNSDLKATKPKAK